NFGNARSTRAGKISLHFWTARLTCPPWQVTKKAEGVQPSQLHPPAVCLTTLPFLVKRQLALAFPFQEQLPKALHRGWIFILAPYEHQWHPLDRLQENEFQRRGGGDYRFRHHPDARARLHIAHYGADQARCVGKPRR